MPTGSSADYRWGFMLLGLQWALDQHRAALRRVAWPRHKVSLSRRDLCPSPPKPAELLPSMQAPGCSLSATTRSKRRLEKIIPDALEFVRALRGLCVSVRESTTRFSGSPSKVRRKKNRRSSVALGLWRFTRPDREIRDSMAATFARHVDLTQEDAWDARSSGGDSHRNIRVDARSGRQYGGAVEAKK